jgi:hypothetical protein
MAFAKKDHTKYALVYFGRKLITFGDDNVCYVLLLGFGNYFILANII